MPIQQYEIYTDSAYAGSLCDSGPRVVQTGILMTGNFGYGVVVQSDSATNDRGIKLGTGVLAHAITLRDVANEANVRPAKKGDWKYAEGDSVPIMREGFIKVKVAGAVAITAGQAMKASATTGELSGDGAIALTNVFAQESGAVGSVIKVRIDIKGG